jgi:hypothetical protein
LRISLKEEIAGESREGIAGEREGDFMDKFIISKSYTCLPKVT